MSDALVWSIVRNNNCFLKKVPNHHGKSHSNIELSSEPGNLMNQNTFKFSGLANSKAVDIAVKDKKIVLSTKVARRSNKPAKSVASTPMNKNVRRVANTINTQLATTNYRGDLKAAALARFARLHRVTKVEAGVVKASALKRGRNSKN